ncbi:gliding motility lipoprotein GldH family protein [Flavobacterium silvaticum]|uniref:Gliding motility lipoprotein GldH n=1 Tax=Flavobacterium silvaticum TaxID=1852020 RepID=A0A972JIX3_9FLAO|nr:hypothetical protein [Flavobacterium silvaticum]NMH27627.1 gliding motility lipoprotein GldH [Flavobacterium silvaticum]
MRTILMLLVSVFSLTIFGCDGNAVFNEKVDSFENNRWQKDKSLDFSVDIEKTGVYSFDIFFSHIYDYQFAKVPLILELKYPDGHIEKDNVTIEIKDSDGKETGDCSGDYCDLWHVIQPPKALQPGHYEVKIVNDFGASYLPNILSVGLKVSAKK